MIAMVEEPEALKRLGVRQLARIRQTHLDLLMQGTILVAIGAAVASVPTWIGILLVLGAYVAPLTLGVLAFRPELQKGSFVYRGLNIAVLTGFTRRLGRPGRHRPLALNPPPSCVAVVPFRCLADEL